jgi:hypothetical protein
VTRLLVAVESPYAADPERLDGGRAENIEYARACMKDCLRRGEAPYASHLLYTQLGILDDDIPEERERGINAGLLWQAQADAVAVYVDRGISKGMRAGIDAFVRRLIGPHGPPGFGGKPQDLIFRSLELRSLEFTPRVYGHTNDVDKEIERIVACAVEFAELVTRSRR